jgi:hypothetical protein
LRLNGSAFASTFFFTSGPSSRPRNIRDGC